MRAYYRHVDRLVVSYDADGVGWTGGPLDPTPVLDALRELDVDHKVMLLPGRYHHPGRHPLESETVQRQEALSLAGRDMDWVLQLDSDEVLPSAEKLLAILASDAAAEVDAVEWPMRVLFRRLRGDRYLYVSNPSGRPHTEYPGPIAVRPSVVLRHARTTDAATLRLSVDGDDSLQLRRPPAANETRAALLTSDDIIWHNSWARSSGAVWKKIGAWGHSEGLRTRKYFFVTWLPAPARWGRMRDFHPFARGLWQQLTLLDELPFVVAVEDHT